MPLLEDRLPVNLRNLRETKSLGVVRRAAAGSVLDSVEIRQPQGSERVGVEVDDCASLGSAFLRLGFEGILAAEYL